MTVNALVPQCCFCFELFRMQNSQNFLGLRPWTPLGRVYSGPQHSPDSKKISGYGTGYVQKEPMLKSTFLDLLSQVRYKGLSEQNIIAGLE